MMFLILKYTYESLYCKSLALGEPIAFPQSAPHLNQHDFASPRPIHP